jgi:hypothetical protein
MPLSIAAIASFAFILAFLACDMWAMVLFGLPAPQPGAMRRVRMISGGAFAGGAVLVWVLALTAAPGLLSPP